MRCPRCSGDSLYAQWNVFKHHCGACGYEFEEQEGNCWFFLYSTSAALTGLFIILIFVWRPHNLELGRVVLGVLSVFVIALTVPIRKAIALALEYISETRGNTLLLYDDSDQEDTHP